mgnify:CR=1 FL=1
MNKKALKTLEYEKIISQLTEYAGSAPGKLLCKNLVPSSDLNEIRQAQAEMEVKNIVYDEKSVPKGRKKRSEHAEESDENAGTAGAEDHRTGEAG